MISHNLKKYCFIWKMRFLNKASYNFKKSGRKYYKPNTFLVLLMKYCSSINFFLISLFPQRSLQNASFYRNLMVACQATNIKFIGGYDLFSTFLYENFYQIWKKSVLGRFLGVASHFLLMRGRGSSVFKSGVPFAEGARLTQMCENTKKC